MSKTNLRSIEAEFQDYAKLIFAGMKEPPGETQISETRKAFYAGCWSILCAVELITTPAIDERDAVWLEKVKLECEAFVKRLITEYALKN